MPIKNKMEKEVKWLMFLMLSITLVLASIPVLAEDVQLNASMSKQSYTPGESSPRLLR